MFGLSLVFVVISIFLVSPIIYLYANNGDINQLTGFAQYSIANLGFDSMQCDSTSFSLGHLLLSCPYGEITNLAPNGFGINTYTNKIRDACLVNETEY